jgi:hypothetical protein
MPLRFTEVSDSCFTMSSQEDGRFLRRRTGRVEFTDDGNSDTALWTAEKGSESGVAILSAAKKSVLTTSDGVYRVDCMGGTDWSHQAWTLEPVHNFSFRLIGAEEVDGHACRVHVFPNGDAVIKKGQ